MKIKNAVESHKLKAFTLTELLVVLVIVGILVMLALPRLMPLISKAKSTEAKVQLAHLQSLELNYFYEHSKYSNSFEDIGFVQEKLTTEGADGKANYRIEIVSATPTTFSAKATAVADFDGDGVFNVWEIDQDKNLRETVKD